MLDEIPAQEPRERKEGMSLYVRESIAKNIRDEAAKRNMGLSEFIEALFERAAQ